MKSFMSIRNKKQSLLSSAFVRSLNFVFVIIRINTASLDFSMMVFVRTPSIIPVKITYVGNLWTCRGDHWHEWNSDSAYFNLFCDRMDLHSKKGGGRGFAASWFALKDSESAIFFKFGSKFCLKKCLTSQIISIFRF